MLKSNNIDNYIKIYKNAISEKLCKSIIEESNDLDWKKHHWTNHEYSITPSTSPDTEFDRAKIIGKNYLALYQIINKLIQDYSSSYEDATFSFSGFSHVNLNKYIIGTKMLKHHDHINSIFDGKRRGIPIVSIVGLLNNDFEGGEFIFWDDHKLILDIGDVAIFPSNFMYKHRVNLVTSGTRYSIVSWVF